MANSGSSLVLIDRLEKKLFLPYRNALLLFWRFFLNIVLVDVIVAPNLENTVYFLNRLNVSSDLYVSTVILCNDSPFVIIEIYRMR